ncbi:MAG: hypothetical protein AB9903_05405 [Vulcanimicrobiota bacterium]
MLRAKGFLGYFERLAGYLYTLIISAFLLKLQNLLTQIIPQLFLGKCDST